MRPATSYTFVEKPDTSKKWKVFYAILTTFGIIAITFSVVANILQIVDMIKSPPIGIPEVMRIISRFLFVFTGLLLTLALCSLSIMEDWFRFLVDWRGFGLALMYLGVVSFAACADSPPLSQSRETARQVACWITIAVGGFYFVLGLGGGARLKLRKTSQIYGAPLHDGPAVISATTPDDDF